MLVVFAGVGCAAVERQEAALEALRVEVRGLGDGLGDVERSVHDVSGRMQAFEQTVGARLDGIDEQLAKPISLPTPICEMPETLPVDVRGEACEAPVEADAGASEDDKTVVGAVEHIRILPQDLVVTARIDTGADSNSLSATNLVYLERDGDDWVRFDVETGEETHTLERRVRRHVRVFQQSDVDGKRRPVVRLRIQLGETLGNFEFNLSDRTHLRHPVILGRSLLVDLMTVDVSREFLQPLPARGD